MASQSVLAAALLAATSTVAVGCGSSTSTPNLGTIDSASDLSTLMENVAVPMAGLFKQVSAMPPAVADSGVGLAALTSPVSCAQGGSISYALSPSAQATFNNCTLEGVVISGTVYATVYGDTLGGGVTMSSGTLTLSGFATGTLEILNCMIQWTNPITDASTYWEISIAYNGATLCAWSGGTTCR
jgi:hypothetical protein